MFQICKNSPPQELVFFRKREEQNHLNGKRLYDKFRDNCQNGFKKLQKSLKEEQYGLCCYCMKELKNSEFRVEHFKPKSKYKCDALSYENLLACCNGINGSIKHCDRSKGDKELKKVPNPATNKMSQFLKKIKFKSNGEIGVVEMVDGNELQEYDKLEIMEDINITLNLNNKLLVAARKEKLKWFIFCFNKVKKKKNKVDKELYMANFEKSKSYFAYYFFVKDRFLANCKSNC